MKEKQQNNPNFTSLNSNSNNVNSFFKSVKANISNDLNEDNIVFGNIQYKGKNYQCLLTSNYK